MSTRCSIHFTWGDDTWANVYRHSDGYPGGESGIFASLDEFFRAVEEQCGRDTRFDDPPYLAAKFIVWQAAKYAHRMKPGTFEYESAPPLAFLGVGVQMGDPDDIAYRYRVDCHLQANGARPTVAWQRRAETEWHIGPEAEEATS